MNRFKRLTICAIAAMSLSACMSEGIDADSTEGVFIIEHTGPGKIYWK